MHVHGILGFIDGSQKCPTRFDEDSNVEGVEIDAYQVWKMHDRALMQLLIETLSSTAISYVVMKSELQTIKKGYETIFQYLQRIKDARDHLSAAWVSFEDDDIVILALSGLPSEYNTFQCVLLAEEATLEHTNSTTLFVSAMMAKDKTFTGKTLGSHFKGRGRGRNHYPSGPRTHQAPPNSSLDILGHGIDIPTCEICNKKGHVAADCYERHNQPSVLTSSVQCQICWKYGHSVIHCYHIGNFSYQGKPRSTNLFAMHANFPSSSSHEQFWDKITGSVLLKGLCTADLYPIPFFTSPPNHKQTSSFHKNHFFLPWTSRQHKSLAQTLRLSLK
ncbi:unnamed protein product [Prunus armeniaca]